MVSFLQVSPRSPVYVSLLAHTCHMPCPSHPYWSDHANNISTANHEALHYAVFSSPLFLFLQTPCSRTPATCDLQPAQHIAVRSTLCILTLATDNYNNRYLEADMQSFRTAHLGTIRPTKAKKQAACSPLYSTSTRVPSHCISSLLMTTESALFSHLAPLLLLLVSDKFLTVSELLTFPQHRCWDSSSFVLTLPIAKVTDSWRFKGRCSMHRKGRKNPRGMTPDPWRSTRQVLLRR